MAGDDEYIGLKELSKRTSLAPRTLRSWIYAAERNLPAFKVRGKIIVKWSDAQQWLRQFRVETIDAAGMVEQMLRKLGDAREEEQDETDAE